jgi:hypothetical protein
MLGHVSLGGNHHLQSLGHEIAQNPQLLGLELLSPQLSDCSGELGDKVIFFSSGGFSFDSNSSH